MPALPSGKVGGCLGRWTKEGAKNAIVWFRKWRTYTKKGNENDESERRSRSLWEDKGTALFQVCCRRVNIFPINFNL